MADTGGAEPGKPPPVASLERALDQVCDFLSRAEQTARVRALVIEARRLRNVVGNWRSIAPDADVREEMIARVLRLANDAEEVVAAERPSSASQEETAQTRKDTPTAVQEARPISIGLRLQGTTSAAASPARPGPEAVAAFSARPTNPALPPAIAAAGDVDLGETLTSADLGMPSLPRGRPGSSPSVQIGQEHTTLPLDRVIAPPARQVGLREAPAAGEAQLERSLTTTFASPPSLVLDRSAPPVQVAPPPPPEPPKPLERSLSMTFPAPPSLVFDRGAPPPRDATPREAPPVAPKPFERSLTGAFPSPPSLVFERVVPPAPQPQVSVPAPMRSMEDTFEEPPSLHLEQMQMRPTPDELETEEPASEFPVATRPDAVSVRALPLPQRPAPGIVMLSDPYSKQADAYRTLRRKLASGTARTIAVTSASPGEGKTTCAINLALALGETTRGRILLVEANLRTPGIARMLQFDPPRCFSEQLRRHRDDRLSPWIVVEQAPAGAAPTTEEASESVDKAASTGSKSGGEPKPPLLAPIHVLAMDPRAERPPMLDAVGFSMGIESLKRGGYAYIIIDTPPVLGGMDMNVIGDSVDGVILTSLVKKSTRKSLRRAIEQLRPAPVLGVLLLDA